MRKTIAFLMLILFIFLTSCAPSQKECSADKDCVPATCCHPTDAVTRENAPDCSGVLCTADCQPGTLDCNQGEIKCIQNKCTVELY
jgi:hypothetical protein